MKKPLLDTFNRIGGKRLNEAHASVSELPEAWIEANKDEYESAVNDIVDFAWEQLSDLNFGGWAEDEGHEWPEDEEETYLMNKIMKLVAKQFE
jgi:hypothetical protein